MTRLSDALVLVFMLAAAAVRAQPAPGTSLLDLNAMAGGAVSLPQAYDKSGGAPPAAPARGVAAENGYPRLDRSAGPTFLKTRPQGLPSYERPRPKRARMEDRRTGTLLSKIDLVNRWLEGEDPNFKVDGLRSEAEAFVAEARKRHEVIMADGSITDEEQNDFLQFVQGSPPGAKYDPHGAKQVIRSLQDWERRAVADDGVIDAWEAVEGLYYIRGNYGGYRGGQIFLKLVLQRQGFDTKSRVLDLDSFDVLERSIYPYAAKYLPGLPMPNAPDGLSQDGAFLTAKGVFPGKAKTNALVSVAPRGGRKSANYRKIFFVNGIQTDIDTEKRYVQMIADDTGQEVIGIYNATNGKGFLGAIGDLYQCWLSKFASEKDFAAISLSEALLQEIRMGREVHVMVHSQGGLVLRDALFNLTHRIYDDFLVPKNIPPAERQEILLRILDMVTVETFGAAAATYPDGPRYFHSVNTEDPVPTELGQGVNVRTDADWHYSPGEGAKFHVFTDYGPDGGHGGEDRGEPGRLRKLENKLTFETHQFPEIYWKHRVDPFSQRPEDKAIWEDSVTFVASPAEVSQAQLVRDRVQADDLSGLAGLLQTNPNLRRAAIVYKREYRRSMKADLLAAAGRPDCRKEHARAIGALAEGL